MRTTKLSDIVHSSKPFRIFILFLEHRITRCWHRSSLFTTGVLGRKLNIDFYLTSTCKHSCCRKDQDKGYIDGYMHVLWWDHSYSYDNSNFQVMRVVNRRKFFCWLIFLFQNPLAEAKQEEPKDGYKYNYNFLYPATKKDKIINSK